MAVIEDISHSDQEKDHWQDRDQQRAGVKPVRCDVSEAKRERSQSVSPASTDSQCRVRSASAQAVLDLARSCGAAA